MGESVSVRVFPPNFSVPEDFFPAYSFDSYYCLRGCPPPRIVSAFDPLQVSFRSAPAYSTVQLFPLLVQPAPRYGSHLLRFVQTPPTLTVVGSSFPLCLIRLGRSITSADSSLWDLLRPVPSQRRPLLTDKTRSLSVPFEYSD